MGSTGGTSLYTAGVPGSADARTSFQTIAGVWGDAAAHVGVFGSSLSTPELRARARRAREFRAPASQTKGKAGVTKTLEYAYDDYSVALLAKELDDQPNYVMLMKKSQNFKHMFVHRPYARPPRQRRLGKELHSAIPLLRIYVP
jgi:Glycosyl hydrolase family 92